MNHRNCYIAFKAKDVRFDGRFFVGVSSTGIYCRPVCKAKLPKAENCTFYDTAAAAEQAGFRPCLLCRPELAPGLVPFTHGLSLASRAARLLEENSGSGQKLEELLQDLGCSGRHLRRVFSAEYKVTPVQYLQTCRLLLAKNLLTDTNLPVTEVAMAAGFGSLRRFNHLFQKQYRLTPTALRRETAGAKGCDSHVRLILGYRPPYQWQQMLNFLASRAIPGVEVVNHNEYKRTVHFINSEQKGVSGWIRVAHHPQKNYLTVAFDSALLPVLPQVLARVRHLFDLYCDPGAVYETLATMNQILSGLCLPGIRLPGCLDPFEMSVQAVLSQHNTMETACLLAGKLAQNYGKPVATGIEGVTHVFPSARCIAVLNNSTTDPFTSLGISDTDAKVIVKLAAMLAQEEIDFTSCAQFEQVLPKLMAIQGLTDWTAQYIAMRALSWPDIFPYPDCGVQKALSFISENEILDRAETWRPWRSYAVVNLWNYLLSI